MGISTFNLFLGRADSASLARRSVWRHSMDTAQCARVITSLLHPAAQETVGIEQAYTCALLHDVGKIGLDRSRQTLFLAIMELTRTRHLRYSVLESQVLPFSHSQIGAALATRWNYPPMLCEVIGVSPHAACRRVEPEADGGGPAWPMKWPIFSKTRLPQNEEGALAALHESCREAHVLPAPVSEDCLNAMTRACRAEIDRGLSAACVLT